MAKEGISAEWVSNRNGKIERGIGTGLRLSKPDSNDIFVGEFEIIYTGEDGQDSPKLNLAISFESGKYHLLWTFNGKAMDVGIGMLSDHKLVASYTKSIF